MTDNYDLETRRIEINRNISEIQNIVSEYYLNKGISAQNLPIESLNSQLKGHENELILNGMNIYNLKIINKDQALIGMGYDSQTVSALNSISELKKELTNLILKNGR